MQSSKYPGAVLAVALIAIVCLAAVGVVYHLAATRDAKPLTVAVMGPMTGSYSGSGQAMLAGATLAADSINERGGIGGRSLKIKAFDTEGKPARARKLAKDIAASDAVAAIGSYFSSVAVKAAPVFKQQRMPAVTGSATNPDLVVGNPYYFQVVPDNNSKGRFSALYTKGVLDKTRVAIVYEADAYGKTLNQAYAREAKRLDMKITDAWAVSSTADDDVDAQINRVVAALQQPDRPDAVFVGLLGGDAARLIDRLHKQKIDVTVIGGDSVGLASFRDAFEQLDNGGSIASASHGVYATTYFLKDVANQQAQAFIQAFKAQHGNEPRPVAATNYDALRIVAAALDGAAPDADRNTLRQRVSEHLPRFDSLTHAFHGVTGRLFFNDNGSVVKPSPFGMYSQGRLISAPVQLTPVVHPGARADLDQLKQRNEVVSMDRQLYYKTNIVYTGVDLQNLGNIDAKDATFDADFYLWFRYARDSGFDPASVQFIHAAETPELGEPVARANGGDRRYQAFRVNAAFQAELDFHDFPFDSQTLALGLRPDKKQSNRLKLVADEIGMHRDNNAADQYSDILNHSNAWRLAGVQVFSDTETTQSTLGNPALLGADTRISYSRFNVVAHIKRLGRSYIISNLAPLFFVLLLGYAMLYVPVEGPPFTARVNLGVLALLTTVSFSMRTSRELPDLSYLILLDYLYYAVYVLLLYGISSSILKLIWTNQGFTVRVHRLDLVSRLMLPILLAAAIVLVMFYFR